MASFRYGICNETFQDWPLDKALELAKRVGYTGWEVAPFMLADDARSITPQQRSDYRSQVEAAGFEVIGLHWLLAKTEGFYLTTDNAEVRKATTEYFCELARLCKDLGGKVMVLGSPQQRNVPEGASMEQAYEFAAEVLRGVVPALEENGVRIALEPLGHEEGNFMNTQAQGRQLREMIGSEHVGLHLDVKAMSDETEDIAGLIRENADLMLHFHANDPNRQGPGMGDVDFAPIFEALDAVDYQGWVSVEVFDYAPGVETLVTESMRNMLAAQA
ncbi:sugar phosphate isomerase/epimerase family protein [Rosistilla oblonga]|uniref:sugar phosphate isomerase/epimerase family protein n=1 Tax=Rosistilla oblonga TaxID=2527990 RepID=UPI003A979678